MSILKTSLPIVLLFLLSYFAWRPLLHSGFFIMHDDQQVARLSQLDKSLGAGQFPVRWVEDLGFGYGYPLFNFYPPLTYYVGETFHLVLRTNFLDSTKAVWFIAIFASGLSMYALAKQFWGKSGGVVSAIFYMFAPYHAVDAYVRGSLAELFSFVWLPLVLLCSYKAIKFREIKWYLGFLLTLSGLMLTHNLIFLPFFPIAMAWIAFQGVLVGSRSEWARTFLKFSLATGLVFLLTAWFWLPSLGEKSLTLVDSLLIKNLASYKIHFVCPSQLWDSSWGFGGSVAGCIDGLSFRIGKLHILVSIASLAVALFVYIQKRRVEKVILLAFGLAAASVYMTTEFSLPVWDSLPVLWYLQFPWRFLEFVALFSSFLAGSLSVIFFKKWQRIAIATLLTILALFVYVKLFVPQSYLPNANDSNLLSDYQVKWHVSSTSFEYLPKGFATTITNLGTVGADIDENSIARSKYIIQSKTAKISNEVFLPSSFKQVGLFPEPTKIQYQITNFKGWRAWINGQEVSIDDNNKYKLITLDVPSGENTIEGKFENTELRKIGNYASLFGLFILILFYGFRRNKK